MGCVQSISPASGPVGTTITLNGQYFNNYHFMFGTSQSNSVLLPCTSITETSATCVIPLSGTGNYQIFGQNEADPASVSNCMILMLLLHQLVIITTL